MGKIAKVLMCGYKQTGKTSIIERFIYDIDTTHPENHCRVVPTIEDIYAAYVDTDRGTRDKLRIIDTAGLELVGSELPKNFINLVDGFVLVFSVTSSVSFKKLEQIKKEIDRHRERKLEYQMVVIANKVDLDTEREVEPATVLHWAQKEKVKLFETSVKDRRSVAEPFVHITSRITQPPSKTGILGVRKKTASGDNDRKESRNSQIL